MPRHAPLARAASSSPAAVLVAALFALLLVAPAHANKKTTAPALNKKVAATAASTSLPGALLDQNVLLAPAFNEGETNRLRQVVAAGSLAAGQATPARLFGSPVVVCATSGCVKAIAKDGSELASQCASAGGAPACASLGGRGSKAFSLVAGGGAAARYIEFAATWPSSPLYANA